MKVKPKEVLVNLPIALTFKSDYMIPEFAANINTIIHGKVKIKYEELGFLGGQYIGLFYINRNDEFTELRKEFKDMIEAEEIEKSNQIKEQEEEEGQANLNPDCDDYDHEGRCNRCGQFDCYECDWG